MQEFEAIVVGAGHAGVEAIFALANKGHNVCLVSLSKSRVAQMPCNPSIGGPAKGIITREIDALGGVQGLFADQAMIQIKMLNDSKGPAVRALRAQIDKEKFSALIIEAITNHPNITFIESSVSEVLVKNNKVEGVRLENGETLLAKAVVITTGTYMDSYVMRGLEKVQSGPDGQKTTNHLSESLKSLGVVLQRLKTGTPPRVLTSSIDFSKVEKEVLSPSELSFSSRSGIKLESQISCYLTYTTPLTHQIIKDNLTKSTMYSGMIVANGPRYCPSIEDKIVRFSDKERHQIFYEPETREGDITYIQGFSSAMPIDIQALMVASLPGMENAKVLKWAYAIEYDAIDPLQLKPSLELKAIDGLFLAGQVNGTSGYEEAACQGLMAGLNAALKLENREPLVIRRDQGYIGVLIDDLVTRGTNEPYRMLTSRAEYRLLLRNDNADQRLAKLGFEAGLLPEKFYLQAKAKWEAIELEKSRLENVFVSANSNLAKKYEAFNGPSLLQMLARPDVDPKDISDFEFLNELVTGVRLEGYIRKQETEAKKMVRLEKLKIPFDINYDLVNNLAYEARQKLKTVRPATIGQAARISGINPADIQMIMFFLNVRGVSEN